MSNSNSRRCPVMTTTPLKQKGASSHEKPKSFATRVFPRCCVTLPNHQRSMQL